MLKQHTSTPNLAGVLENELTSLSLSYGMQKYSDVISGGKALLKTHPQPNKIYHIIGCAQLRLSKLDDAIESFSSAIQHQPIFPEAIANLGETFRRRGNHMLAMQFYEKALLLDPDQGQALFGAALIHKARGSIRDAVEYLVTLINGDNPPIGSFIELGDIFTAGKEIDAAIDTYKKGLSRYPNCYRILNNLGFACYLANCHDDAKYFLQRALDEEPRSSLSYNNLGNVYRAIGLLPLAKASYLKAIELNPEFAGAYRNLSAITNFKDHPELVVALERLVKNKILQTDDLVQASFALAAAYENLALYERAFQRWQLANWSRKKALGYSLSKDRKLFASLKECTPELKKFAPLFKALEPASVSPIFILGMPRSGTTLVEQIISAHSRIYGGGELESLAKLGLGIASGNHQLTDKHLVACRDGYLATLKSKAGEFGYMTDKMPHNFRLVGLIRTIFPDAKVVNCLRDPAATCWSNYKLYFPTDELGYCYDLDDVAGYYRLYRDLMDHWEYHFPGDLYHVDYESLVTDPVSEIKNLFNYLEIPPEAGCFAPEKNLRPINTASANQARQPIYNNSSSAWKNYRPWLKECFDQF